MQNENLSIVKVDLHCFPINGNNRLLINKLYISSEREFCPTQYMKFQCVMIDNYLFYSKQIDRFDLSPYYDSISYNSYKM